MTTGTDAGVAIDVPVAIEAVFGVLADGWNYSSWVVGASRIRDADPDWPAEGSRIHHSIGPWPLAIEDFTQVLAVDAPRLLVLEARLWPVGRARIRFDLTGDGRRTRVRMTELAARGPAVMLPAPLQARIIAPRNRETLRRLCRIAQARPTTGPQPDTGGPSA